jgi:hypothetical protein
MLGEEVQAVAEPEDGQTQPSGAKIPDCEHQDRFQ